MDACCVWCSDRGEIRRCADGGRRAGTFGRDQRHENRQDPMAGLMGSQDAVVLWLLRIRAVVMETLRGSKKKVIRVRVQLGGHGEMQGEKHLHRRPIEFVDRSMSCPNTGSRLARPRPTT